MNSRRARSAPTSAGRTFNVLWHRGDSAVEHTRGIVMDAAGVLRRLGVDVRVRMTADAAGAPGTAREPLGPWADTVLVVDDATRAPQDLLADLETAAGMGPHVILCELGGTALEPEALAGLRVDVVELCRPDGALLAAAWLSLAERAAQAADDADTPVETTTVR